MTYRTHVRWVCVRAHKVQDCSSLDSRETHVRHSARKHSGSVSTQHLQLAHFIWVSLAPGGVQCVVTNHRAEAPHNSNSGALVSLFATCTRS